MDTVSNILTESMLAAKGKGFAELIEDIVSRNNGEDKGFNRLLNIRLISASKIENVYSADYSYRVSDDHLNPYGEVHGGIAAALFDTCIGYTAAGARMNPVTTTDMSISYYRALTGPTFRLHVELTHIGRKMVSGHAKIFNDRTGELCCAALSTYMVLAPNLERVKV